MKKYSKELLLLLLQAAAFYLFPPFALPFGPMGLVMMLLLFTFLLAVLMGLFSGSALKYLFPAAAALLFIPSVFIYYNESALIHALWYLVISLAGLLPASLARRLLRK